MSSRILHKYSCFIDFIKQVDEHNELYEINYTGAQMLNSVYHMILK